VNRFQNLPHRIRLTLEYEGLWGFIRKSVRFVIRLTPIGRLLKLGDPLHDQRMRAKRWYRRSGRFVTIVIPSYGDPGTTIKTVTSVRRTTKSRMVRVIVVDDGSPRNAQDRLRREAKAEVVLNGENVGFAQNVNRVLRRLIEDDTGDVVVLNSDIVAHRGWLESLQYAAYAADDTGIVGPKLLYPDRAIQFAGTCQNADQPQWFDHKFRFKPADYGPANVAGPVLGVTGACMYMRAEVLRAIGIFDDGFEMAFEDIDYCLRAWQNGCRVIYYPPAELTHLESHSRGTIQGERELVSLRYFWGKWGNWFDRRAVTTESGSLRIAYVTEDTGVGGGHRDIFEHLNRLGERGHEVVLYTLGPQPDWFDLNTPVKTFADYEELIAALSEVDAIKVATWWGTAEPTWLASVRRGIPVYFVQDIETSYYPDDVRAQHEVLASYKPEFRYITISSWNRARLAELGLSGTLMPPGVDLDTFRPIDVERNENALLAVGRSHPLKNLDLTGAAWRRLPEPRPELWMFGIEPDLGPRFGARYFRAPSDEQVNELMNRSTVFIQTSRHEGFCLPLLEAMAAGTPVVCTDAHGNRDFCVDRVNCLMVEPEPEAVANAVARLFSSPKLRQSLVEQGRTTAAEYLWERRIDALEEYFLELSQDTSRARPVQLAGGRTPRG
jgi:GT2 family glycosyltransferase